MKRLHPGLNSRERLSDMSQPAKEEGGMQRPAGREDHLTDDQEKVANSGPKKSKTLQVMEDCEKRGEVAPSVFGGVKSGGNTTSARK
ncbi:musculoskeletal embryonic nuclear protein 1a [Nerophis ophidion]|uniref:musculoskeletal embryonic nuclear protein 1a n=1 Tax=Nerophis ophidion TaxID=159077 RepID=UPI002AE03221|nr:musculoskeletal embryonic nuclear protein 1a [Nerophis ophidion]